MSQVYEKPAIRKLQTGFMNKFGCGAASGPPVQTEIDGADVDDLVSRFGSPLFAYSEKTIRRKCREMRRAFSTRYPDVTLAWSYKTNYLGAVCALMHQEGAMAEVVSGMEYEMARNLGIPGERIVFNGPHKSKNILKTAAGEGACINVDHIDEIEALEAVAAELGRSIHVGIRINLDAGIYPMWSRFGFNLESGEALEAVERMVAGDKLIPTGVHCHIGTFILDPEAYRRQVEKMMAFAYEVEDKFGLPMAYLDIGGGFPSRNRLKNASVPGGSEDLSIDTYAAKICDALLKNLRPGHFPKLIVESGRALIDESGTLITSVVADKRLPDGTKAYVVDAGVNLLFTANWYRFNIALDRTVPGLAEVSIVYGPLCMNIDVIDEGLMLPPLRRGVRLLVSPVGAYNNTQWMQFIHYRPSIVLIGEDGQSDIIREAEDLTDICRRERLPARLTTGLANGGFDEAFSGKIAA